MENTKAHLFKALAEFQQECPTIHKATQGYGYSYADLPTIFEVINPLLKKNGLGFTQLLNEGDIVTILFHVASGESIESFTNIPKDVELKGMNPFQVYGSACTYMRRYSLSSILGIVTDKDTDANGEQKKKAQPKAKAIKPKGETTLSEKRGKAILSENRFTDALTALGEGKTTYNSIAEYKLTDEQKKDLLEYSIDLETEKK